MENTTRKTRRNLIAVDFDDGMISRIRTVAGSNSMSLSQTVRLLVRKALSVEENNRLITIEIPREALLGSAN
jgi:hypothetical protein